MTEDLAERLARVLAAYEGPEHAPLREFIRELVAAIDRRDALIADLTSRVARMEAAVTGLQRAGKRQAAPFYKKLPKANPKKSGRKPGDGYGPKAHRAVPARFARRHSARRIGLPHGRRAGVNGARDAAPSWQGVKMRRNGGRCPQTATTNKRVDQRRPSVGPRTASVKTCISAATDRHGIFRVSVPFWQRLVHPRAEVTLV